jgi:hypothetical protein
MICTVFVLVALLCGGTHGFFQGGYCDTDHAINELQATVAELQLSISKLESQWYHSKHKENPRTATWTRSLRAEKTAVAKSINVINEMIHQLSIPVSEEEIQLSRRKDSLERMNVNETAVVERFDHVLKQNVTQPWRLTPNHTFTTSSVIYYNGTYAHIISLKDKNYTEEEKVLLSEQFEMCPNIDIAMSKTCPPESMTAINVTKTIYVRHAFGEYVFGIGYDREARFWTGTAYGTSIETINQPGSTLVVANSTDSQNGGLVFNNLGISGVTLDKRQYISIQSVIHCIEKRIEDEKLPHAQQCANSVIEAPSFVDLVARYPVFGGYVI